MSIGAFLGNLGTVLDGAQSQMKRQQEVKMKQIEFQHAQQAAQLGAIADKIDMAAQLHQANGGDQQPPSPYSVSQGFQGFGGGQGGGGAPGGPGPLPGAQRMAPPPGAPQQPQPMMPGQQVRPQNPQMQGGMPPGGGGGPQPQQPGLGGFQPTTFNDVVQQMRAVAPRDAPQQAILIAARNAWPQIQQANRDKLEVFKAQQAADDRKDTQLDREQFHADREADSQATRALSAQEHADSLAMRREALALQAGKGQIFQKPDGSLVRVTEDGRSVPINDSVGLTKPGAGGGAQPRSATAVLIKSFMQEHPKATTEQIQAFLADNAGLMAGEHTLGAKVANTELLGNEVAGTVPIVLDASNKVSRTEYPTLNRVIEAGRAGTGDTNVVRLGIAVTSLIDIYSKYLNGGGPATDSSRAQASRMLNEAWSKGQIGAAADQISQEIARGRAMAQKTKSELTGGVSGGAQPQAAPAQIKTDADYAALPSGAEFIAPDGSHRRKP